MLGAVLVSGGLGGCQATADRAALTVWAASSLSDVLPRAARAWAHAGGTDEVVLSFVATSRGARQLAAGAPADLFFAADPKWITWAAEHDLVDPRTHVPVLRNRLVVVVPARSAVQLAEVGDLGAAPIAPIALAGRGVPAGDYAEAALRGLGLWARVRPRLVRGGSVRATLAWIARGHVEAGVVYASDAHAEPRVRVAALFPPSSHPAIVYSVARTTTSARAGAAARFVAFCRGARAARVFEAAGFEPVRGGT